ncbi:MAG: antitoxin MazE [Pseudomonadota bacterium]|jgi:hypothetical protein
MTKAAPSSRDKVQLRRQRLRAQGLRPIQFWVPDVRTPGFREETRRQAFLLAASRDEPADQAFIEAVQEPWPE